MSANHIFLLSVCWFLQIIYGPQKKIIYVMHGGASRYPILVKLSCPC